jgi:type II secretory pathway pseudopilin PulG
MRSATQPCLRSAMTLVEILVVIGIALVLIAILVPALGVVRERAASAQARTLVQNVHTAMGLYRAEEIMRRFPAMPADHILRAGSILDHLAERGLAVNGENTRTVDAGAAALVDPWKQPVQYHLDDHTNGDGVAVRPRDAAGDPVRVPEDVTDWNPPRGSPARAVVPYAYIWSWSRPRSGHQLRDQATRWLYVSQEAAQP